VRVVVGENGKRVGGRWVRGTPDMMFNEMDVRKSNSDQIKNRESRKGRRRVCCAALLSSCLSARISFKQHHNNILHIEKKLSPTNTPDHQQPHSSTPGQRARGRLDARFLEPLNTPKITLVCPGRQPASPAQQAVGSAISQQAPPPPPPLHSCTSSGLRN